MPGYEPYLTVADFNGDRHEDFAIVLAKIGKSKKVEGVLTIFNGPFTATPRPPAFVGTIGELSHRALTETQQQHYPIVGHLYSEGCIYKPHDDSYREDCGED